MKLEFKDKDSGLPLPLCEMEEKEMVKLSLQKLPNDIDKAIEQLRLALLWILHQMDLDNDP